MKVRTGGECKKTKCKSFKYYSNWFSYLGSQALRECMDCKHAHVSQYRPSKEASND